jgi:hypothetical protein
MCNLIEIVAVTAKKSMPLIVDIIVLSMILGPPDTNDDQHELYESRDVHRAASLHGNTNPIPETEYRKRHQLF